MREHVTEGRIGTSGLGTNWLYPAKMAKMAAFFCDACGSKLHQNSKYCHNCGKKASQIPTGDGSKQPTISYEEFRRQKENTRQSQFKRSDRKIPLKAKKEKSAKAKIQVGLVTLDQNTNHLKKMKGRTIPVLLSTDVDANSLLSTAVEKHARHFKQFNGSLDYVVLYSDMSLVRFLPGSLTRFTLEKYKEDLLKPYSKIYFWLCEKSEFEGCDESSGDSDLEKPSIYTIPSTSTMSYPSDPSNVAAAAPPASSSHPSTAITPPLVSSQSSAEAAPPVITIDVDDIIDANHQCPTCLLHFPLSAIEEHADNCAEGWIDPIGHCVVDEEEHEEVDIVDEADSESMSMEEKLETIKSAVANIQSIYATSNLNRVNIRRSSAFKDYSAARKKKWFKPKNLLKITFLGEPAVDDGGLKREFFSEVFSYIKSTFFDQDGMPYTDMRALANEDFKVIGELMGYSIIQGGPAPCLLSVPVYQYIVNGMSSLDTKDAHVWLSQVRDVSLKEHIEQLNACKSDEEVVKLLTEDSMLDVLLMTGYRGVPSRETLDSAKEIVRSLVIAGITKTLTIMDQLVVGMQSFHFLLEYMKKNEKLMQSIFTVEGKETFKPTSDILLGALKPDFCADGSNQKTDEIDIHKNFCDYVQDLEMKEGGLSRLYKFITGSNSFTPLALEKTITVNFKYGCPAGCRCRPTASTCEPSIYLPMHYKDAKQFEDCMNSALEEAVGFGLL